MQAALWCGLSVQQCRGQMNYVSLVMGVSNAGLSRQLQLRWRLHAVA